MPKLGVASKMQLQAILEYTQVLNRAKSCQIPDIDPPCVDSLRRLRAERLRDFTCICLCFCCFSSFSRFNSLPTPIHKGGGASRRLHKGGRPPSAAAPLCGFLYGWVCGGWGGSRRGRNTRKCAQNMHMHAHSTCDV